MVLHGQTLEELHHHHHALPLETTNPSTHPLTTGDTRNQLAISTIPTLLVTKDNPLPLFPHLTTQLTVTPDNLFWPATVTLVSITILLLHQLFVTPAIHVQLATTPTNLGVILVMQAFGICQIQTILTLALTTTAGIQMQF